MDPRRLKVGDIVDDYCPRERRVTDHAIVAMIDETIRQTRCTACDNEHPYKEARTPRTRRKTTTAALYQEVLSNVTDAAPAAPQSAVVPAPPEVPAQEAEAVAETPDVPAQAEAAPEPEEPTGTPDEGPVHRPLIRATLPRPQGDTPTARPIPEFTIRQPGGRGRFRDDFRGNGFRTGGRNGNHQGQGRPNRPGGPGNQQSRGRHHGRPGPHKKRSR